MNEYEVIWSGAHDGQDRDLLCVAPWREKTVMGSLANDQDDRRRLFVPGSVRDVLLRILSTARLQARTLVELEKLTGCAVTLLQQTLYRLRDDGLVMNEPVPGVSGTGRPRQRYWLVRR